MYTYLLSALLVFVFSGTPTIASSMPSPDNRSLPTLGPKLRAYVAKVETVTGRRVRLEWNSGTSIPSVTASFWPHPTDVLVLLNKNSVLGPDDLEQTIAHEVTHGLLLYGRGYWYIRGKTDHLDPYDVALAELAGSMIADIVVNKVIQDEGFPPFPSDYVAKLEAEIKLALGGFGVQRVYEPASRYPNIRSKYAAMRYLFIWSALRFYRLNDYTRAIFQRFLGVFGEAYPQEYQLALALCRLHEQHDPFTSEGNRQITETTLRQWEMTDRFKVVQLR